MTQKERLTDLIYNAPKIDFPKGSRAQGKTYQTASNIADHLLANGVVAVDVDAVSVENRPLISQYLGHPIDEIIALIRAKEEGRIIVPPCKEGQTVYMPWEWGGTKGVAILTINRIVVDFTSRSIVNTDFFSDDEEYWLAYNCGRFDFKDFGKTVFLTKEEAEKALKGGAV